MTGLHTRYLSFDGATGHIATIATVTQAAQSCLSEVAVG